VVIHQTEREVAGLETGREALRRLRDKLASAMEYSRLGDKMRRAAEHAIFRGDLALMRKVAQYLDMRQARELPEYAGREREAIEQTRRS
jgi:hypothetical protein